MKEKEEEMMKGKEERKRDIPVGATVREREEERDPLPVPDSTMMDPGFNSNL